MTLQFSQAFQSAVRKHSSIKEAVRRKVDQIATNPVALGEPLKGRLRGYLSSPVRGNFLIIYLFCETCRKKGDDVVVLCADCAVCNNDTLKFIALGPHDEAYASVPAD